MAVIPYEPTDVVDEPWDANEMRKNIKDGDVEALMAAHAWYDETAIKEGEPYPSIKSAYKFIHHMVNKKGEVGAANIKACQSAIGFLNGAMGGTKIPDHDIQGVYNHLAKHLKDAGLEPPTLKRNTSMNNKEVRTIHLNAEIRAVQQGDAPQKKIVGYALKFNQPSNDLGFIEIIDRHALDNTDMSDVVALINHDPNLVLGRTTSGTLKLKVDDIGLYIEVMPTDTSYARDLIANMEAGNISQCSFAFVVADDGDDWKIDEETGIITRTILNIAKLYDVSIVTFPAYSQTEAVVAQRKAQNLKAEAEQRKNRERLKKKIEIELELM
ncbi:peptidase U35 [Caldanaerobacter subterraneus subsp. yonseiensis KB-1]|uniref:Peptidase U35 n=1 Tax=Caldanaerobacter subterraneus subsp. yonseiensis KB-1 TaxID=1388761 RepID=U5CV04_CALSX|nr:HK97 family phage prohead protease [Caldanaerobacter subterraneus]ERM91897.1 peptidase U35 [Caldanaerobacter subterraneus subsp. yonseiensis KB-1]